VATRLPISTHITGGKQLDSQPLFDMHAYIGDTGNCAILHHSKANYQPADEKVFDSL
jgi:hypothetical protein